MREQIGWFNNATNILCSLKAKREDAEFHKDYVVPVFADDETEKESGVSTLLQVQVWNRILTNQQRMMFAMCDLGTLDMDARSTLAEACVRTGEILCKIGATG